MRVTHFAIGGRSRELRSYARQAIAALLLCAISIHAQQPTEDKLTELYENRPVGIVDVVARPTIDVEQLKPLVTQKAGTPFSSRQIQDSLAALKSAGLFSKVSVNVEPDVNGLRVEFVLEPAFYIGAIDFPGALGRFDYPQLLQVVNYPPQEPYEESRVRAAETALQRYLIGRGYFESQVRAETQLDHDHLVANVLYRVTLNKKADFGNLEIAGLPEAEADKIEGSMRSLKSYFKGAYVKKGRGYNPERLRGATDLIQDKMADSNRLAADIRMDPPKYEPSTKRADIVFRVKPGPTVSVRTEGAKVSRGRLKQLIPIYEENTFDRDLVREGQDNLVSYFQRKGFFDVAVTPDITENPDQISLVYTIQTGQKKRVVSVSVVGNRHWTESEILAIVSVKPGRFLSRGSFSNQLLSASADAIKSAYLNAGFEDASVESRLSDEQGHLAVTFVVEEGARTFVNSFDLTGNESQDITALAPEGLNIAPGTPFSQSRLHEDRDHIIASYLDLGYANADFEATVTPVGSDSHRVDVLYKVTEGPRVRIAETATLGQQTTKPSFINRVAQLRAGDAVSLGASLAAESRLYNEGIFDWVSINSRRPVSDQTEETMLVRVHESRRNTLNYGFGYELSPRTANIPAGTVALPGSVIGLPSGFKVTQQQFSSPRASLEYIRRNMRGRAETASVALVAARIQQRLALSYGIPHFRSYSWGALTSISGERSSENPIFTSRVEEFSFQGERPLDSARTQTLQLRYRFNRTNLSNIRIPELVLEEDRYVRMSTVSASYIRDTRDKPLDAHRGTYQTIDFGLTPRWFGSTANFGRLLGQASYYREVRPSIVWANNIRIGLAKSFSGTRVPISQRYFSGGGTSLRGFPTNGAGPQRIVPVCNDPNDASTCTNITVPTGGNAVFIINTEMRFPLKVWQNLGAAVFYDGGNVYDRIGLGHVFSDFSNSVGFGLRYDTKIGPIRFDVGRNLQPVAGLKATQFFVTLGQAF